MSVRETALNALLAAIKPALEMLEPGAVVGRNLSATHELVTDGEGRLICSLTEGEAGDVDVLIAGTGSLTQETRVAVVDVVLADPDDAQRDARIDAALDAIADAVSADPYLGGVADYALATPPVFDADRQFAETGVKLMTVPVELYLTSERTSG